MSRVVDEVFRPGGDGPVLIGLIGFDLVGGVALFLQFAVDEGGRRKWVGASRL